eukprot:2058973-Prymnesium_polylepis.1
MEIAGKPFYAASMTSYSIFDLDAVQTRDMWSHAATDSLSIFNARMECVAVAAGLSAGFLEPGLLENRRAGRHIYRVRWRPSTATTTAPSTALLIGQQPLPLTRPAQSFASPVDKALIVMLACARGPESLRHLPALQFMLVLVQITASSAQPVWIVTQNTQANESSFVQPEHASGWSWARAVRTEVPKCTILSVDIAIGHCRDSPPALRSVEAETMLSVAAAFIPRLCNCRLTDIKPHQGSQIVEDLPSIHCVTGGTGALGLITSRWLASLSKVRVFIGSRTGFLPEASVASVAALQINAMVCNVGETSDAL